MFSKLLKILPQFHHLISIHIEVECSQEDGYMSLESAMRWIVSIASIELRNVD